MPIIQSLDRALKIIDLFDEMNKELKITEISARMGLHKSTVHSLLKTLQEHRYIDQDPETGKYRLGLKLMERASFVTQSLDIRTLSRRFLEALSEQTGLTVHLVILDGKEGVYIDKVEGVNAVIRYSRIGKRVPVHSSAVGKALVAFKNPAELNRMLEGYEYKIHTPSTITNEFQFREELKKVRDNGYSTDCQENEPGVQCYAVPIRDHSGQVVAAISISMLAAGAVKEETDRFIGMLQSAGAEISRLMGCEVPVSR
ncbi:IclR family transcriptional regulator [Ferviditalea candida]|uniref:IclR family transcriptional regulator n=1 Tax=Ferviditalea candida TaxID=3108399 RepID=A0ABU5ZNS9_9BACL|nr:IclR family transcriptional regulator [Paenibacillaceae bacterium T2]